MRVITEERLKELMFEWDGMDPFVQSCKFLIENECKELDHLTVTKLRPMSELDQYGVDNILAWNESLRRYVHFTYDTFVNSYWIHEFDSFYTIDEKTYKGWLPMPIYKPE